MNIREGCSGHTHLQQAGALWGPGPPAPCWCCLSGFVPLQAQLPPSPSSGNKAIIEKFTAHVPGSTAHWAAVVSDSSRIPELLHAHRFHWSCGFAPSSQGQREVGDAHPPPCPQSPSPRMESMTSAHLLLYCLITLTKLTPRG